MAMTVLEGDRRGDPLQRQKSGRPQGSLAYPLDAHPPPGTGGKAQGKIL